MWKNIAISILVVTVAATAIMAVVETQGRRTAVADAAAVQETVAPTETMPPAIDVGAEQTQLSEPGDRTATPQALNQAVDNVGEPWVATATIVELGEMGMTVALDDGSQVYVELGPPFFWQAQGTLAAGDAIKIDGFYNGDQYHAAAVTQADGSVLALRSEAGQPLWSGGVANSGDASHGSQDAGGTGEVQVAPEDWVTITATVAAVNRNGLTIETTNDEVLVLSFGRPGFWQEQTVQFSAGDAVEVKGFWQDGQFQTGQVTKTETGERLLLRDPNGRPLWGGPGRNGGQGQGHATPTNG